MFYDLPPFLSDSFLPTVRLRLFRSFKLKNLTSMDELRLVDETILELTEGRWFLLAFCDFMLLRGRFSLLA